MKNINIRAIILGLGVGVLAVVVLTAGAAALMARGAAPLECMDYFTAGILVLSGLVSALAARLGGSAPADGIVVAVGELVVLLGVHFCLGGGPVEGLPVTALALGGGSGAAWLLGQGRGRKRRRRR